MRLCLEFQHLPFRAPARRSMLPSKVLRDPWEKQMSTAPAFARAAEIEASLDDIGVRRSKGEKP